ncbi:hypothetical protein FRC11_007917 [Ceratobasidium sp. 423]|nr:hypothetical protein FRC11_007917 [Ceratobasidium sp. 423]
MGGKAELMLTYVVSNAGVTSKIVLHYRASITQTTGENWPEVTLTLSTASPQLGSKVPTISPWKIGFPTPSPPPSQPPVVIQTDAQSRFLSRADPYESSDSEDELPVATAGVLSATFGIPGRSDIPSDEGSHKVVVAVLDLEADLEWICVPREKESVFLTRDARSVSDLRPPIVQGGQLERIPLPGEASVFMDDNFVSKSHIDRVSPNDSFKTSLGVDSSLWVTYPSVKTLNRTTTQSGFSFRAREKQSISAQSQRITIRNSRLTSVSDLRVIDHLAVSTDVRLKVNVITPSGLDTYQPHGSPTNPDSEGKNELPWTNVQKGVKARWAPLDVGGEGTVEWRCEIGPGDEVELELAWEVSLQPDSDGRTSK